MCCKDSNLMLKNTTEKKIYSKGAHRQTRTHSHALKIITRKFRKRVMLYRSKVVHRYNIYQKKALPHPFVT